MLRKTLHRAEEQYLSGFYETAVGSKAVPGFLLLGVLFLLLLE
jgi:hypothetical protein